MLYCKTLYIGGDNMAMTEAQKRYEQKRMKECKNYTIKYRLYIETEKTEQERLQSYLDDTGQSANSYIKELIKRDLEEKGIQKHGI